MKKLSKYIQTNPERKALPTKLAVECVELAQASARKLGITLREFLEAAIRMAADEIKQK